MDVWCSILLRDMARCKNVGYFLLIVAAFSAYPMLVKAEVKSVSACHGTSSTTCNYITLECNPGFSIRLLNMTYGVKTDTCKNSNNRCLDPDKNGCCVPSGDDCMEYYSDLHAYNLHRECSGKQSCGPLPVPNSVLYDCESQAPSTYVHVMYECVAVSDDVAVSLCRENSFDNLNGRNISVLFNSTVDVFSRPTDCSCFISSEGKIDIDYVDVRMTKAFTTNQGSDCSAAELTSTPDDNTDTNCDNNLNEEENFVFAELAETNVKNIEVKLLNLYKNGNNDAPEFIWLNINAKDQKTVDVQCFKHVDQLPTTTSPPYVTTTERDSNTTDDALTDDDDSNTGAIVAGILVPIIVLAVVGAVIAFFVWKRRGNSKQKKQPHATANRYTDSVVIDNSVENSEYAEIGFVPDEPETEPPYDPVYEPNKKTGNDTCNGHGYQNVGNLNKEDGKQSKKPKSPLGKLKSHTDRLISFFRNQHENDFPQPKMREKDVSDGSYDHLRPTSANSEVHVEITPPSDEPQHTYSHTTDESVKRQVASKEENVVNKKNGKMSPKIKRKSGVPAEDINAVHVGDSYIEFQFGTMDKNHPNLVKAEETRNTRPVPPSRPPPSPSSAAKFDKTPSPKSTPKQTRDVLNVKEDSRSKSPNFLAPGHAQHEDSAPNYDYAAGTKVPSRNASPRGSDVSDISSEHSYKILEEQQVYDYADVSDSETADEAYQSGSVYEDVDKDPRLASVKKHKSAADVPQDPNEYLEPITSRTRTLSSPGVIADKGDDKTKPKTQMSNASLLKRELKEKTRQKGQANASKNIENKNNEKGSKTVVPKKQNVRDESGAVKSDNVKSKDYQKMDDVKGVLKMAKMFENKDSDSDSSRQNSPRHINVTNSPDLKKHIDRTVSNA